MRHTPQMTKAAKSEKPASSTSSANYKLFLSGPALADIENILEWTTGAFGAAGRQRYAALIQTALLDLAADPKRLGTRPRDDIGTAICTYHLAASRKRTTASTQVAKPRHLIIFRMTNKSDVNEIQVLRLLHDSMDFVQHVPTDD
ncbi:MAG: type II toxin-antitoxin system RelE/ParE family toxin [Burkholderiaceae bacterium]|nr:type II toxin-antitoxin system RelE/ParE family toxin [Burkholderiaceae bacterium]